MSVTIGARRHALRVFAFLPPGGDCALIAFRNASITVAVAMFLVTSPVFDCDLYWHLANGRAMVESGSIVNEEIFSFTSHGTRFTNHEWLSQLAFHEVWRTGGPNGLVALKLAFSAVIALLMFSTASHHGLRGWQAGLPAVLAVAAGLSRYEVRPELFSLLGIALLIRLLHGSPALESSRHLRWSLAAILNLWDVLHGAIYGWAFVAVHVLAARLTPGTTVQARPVASNLEIGCAVALLASLVNPYGILTYGHFVGLAAGRSGAASIVELQPLLSVAADRWLFLFVVAAGALLFIASRSRWQEALVPIAFVAGALRWERMVGVAALVVSAALGRYLVLFLRRRAGRAPVGSAHSVRRRAARSAVIAVSFVILVLVLRGKFPAGDSANSLEAYRLPPPSAFGFGMNDLMTPAGSLRFLEFLGLEGNLYNNANLGGYLAYYAAPDRPIFQYNFPPVFGDPNRWLSAPRELERWSIDIALAGNNSELRLLFPRDEWAWVYSDYVSTLVLRRREPFLRIIERFEVSHFAPELPLHKLDVRVADPGIRSRVVFEMTVYCAFTRDKRLWSRLEAYIGRYPSLVTDAETSYFLTLARQRQENGASDPLEHSAVSD